MGLSETAIFTLKDAFSGVLWVGAEARNQYTCHYSATFFKFSDFVLDAACVRSYHKYDHFLSPFLIIMVTCEASPTNSQKEIQEISIAERGDRRPSLTPPSKVGISRFRLQ